MIIIDNIVLLMRDGVIEEESERKEVGLNETEIRLSSGRNNINFGC